MNILIKKIKNIHVFQNIKKKLLYKEPTFCTAGYKIGGKYKCLGKKMAQ